MVLPQANLTATELANLVHLYEVSAAGEPPDGKMEIRVSHLQSILARLRRLEKEQSAEHRWDQLFPPAGINTEP